MGLKNQNVEMWQGDTETLSFALVGNLSSPTGKWTLSATPGGAVLVTKAATMTQTDGVWALDVALVKADTLELAPGIYWHEAAVFNGGSEPKTVAVGILKLNPSNAR